MVDRLRGNYRSNGLFGALWLIFAAIALLLAGLGLYAVIADSVGRRTQEMGVRIAIGATRRDIRKLVLIQGMRPAGIGLVLGVAGSLGVNQMLASQLVGVGPNDPIALIAASVSMILAATLGCLLPARRVVRLDVLTALRHD